MAPVEQVAAAPVRTNHLPQAQLVNQASGSSSPNPNTEVNSGSQSFFNISLQGTNMDLSSLGYAWQPHNPESSDSTPSR